MCSNFGCVTALDPGGKDQMVVTLWRLSDHWRAQNQLLQQQTHSSQSDEILKKWNKNQNFVFFEDWRFGAAQMMAPEGSCLKIAFFESQFCISALAPPVAALGSIYLLIGNSIHSGKATSTSF